MNEVIDMLGSKLRLVRTIVRGIAKRYVDVLLELSPRERRERILDLLRVIYGFIPDAAAQDAIFGGLEMALERVRRVRESLDQQAANVNENTIVFAAGACLSLLNTDKLLHCEHFASQEMAVAHCQSLLSAGWGLVVVVANEAISGKSFLV